MRFLIQRVKKGSVKIESLNYSKEIGKGFVVLVGFHAEDTEEKLDFLLNKLLNLRIFEDTEGKMNLSLLDVSGEVLLISQFTLYADTKKGNRPGFSESMKSEQAETFFQNLVQKMENAFGKERIKTGIFGANMLVEIHNDGPVTILLEK